MKFLDAQPYYDLMIVTDGRTDSLTDIPKLTDFPNISDLPDQQQQHTTTNNNNNNNNNNNSNRIYGFKVAGS